MDLLLVSDVACLEYTAFSQLMIIPEMIVRVVNEQINHALRQGGLDGLVSGKSVSVIRVSVSE